MRFNINTSEVVAYTNKLEKMHKSALPVSIRGALNDASFNAKTKFIPREFNENFEQRKKNFIRSHTAFNRSPNTFDINKMVSEAGVIKGKSDAGDNLEKQEFGGTIRNREYIPMNPARVSGSKSKLVSKRFYIKNIKPQRGKRKSKRQEFIRAAIKAGKGGFIKYDDFLFSVRSIKKQKGNKLFIKADPIYSFEESRAVNISKAPFIWPAGLAASKKIPEYFIKQAEKRIK